MAQAPTATLDYSVVGQGTVPLVVLHGLGGTRRQPLAFIDKMLHYHCRVIAPDLRGHGSTGLDHQPARLSFSQLAADVEQLPDVLAAQSGLVVMGISMGAAVATELAARANLDIRALLLVRPAWLWSPAPANLTPLPVIGELLQQLPPAQAREKFVATSEYAAISRSWPAAATGLLSQFDDPGAAERWHRLVTIPAVAPQRPRSAPPTRVLGASQDPVHPVQLAAKLANDLDGDLGRVLPRYDLPRLHQTGVTMALHQVLAELRTGLEQGRD